MFRWVSLAFFVFITAFPLVYMISLSFKDIAKILQSPSDFLPSWDEISGFETYRAVLRDESEGGYGFVGVHPQQRDRGVRDRRHHGLVWARSPPTPRPG